MSSISMLLETSIAKKLIDETFNLTNDLSELNYNTVYKYKTNAEFFKLNDPIIQNIYIYDIIIINKLYAIVYRLLWYHLHITLNNDIIKYNNFISNVSIKFVDENNNNRINSNGNDINEIILYNLFSTTNLKLNIDDITDLSYNIYNIDPIIINSYNTENNKNAPLFHYIDNDKYKKFDFYNYTSYINIIDNDQSSLILSDNILNINIKNKIFTKKNLNDYYTSIKSILNDNIAYNYHRILLYLNAFNNILNSDSITLFELNYSIYYYNLLLYNSIIQNKLDNIYTITIDEKNTIINKLKEKLNIFIAELNIYKSIIDEYNSIIDEDYISYPELDISLISPDSRNTRLGITTFYQYMIKVVNSINNTRRLIYKDGKFDNLLDDYSSSYYINNLKNLKNYNIYISNIYNVDFKLVFNHIIDDEVYTMQIHILIINHSILTTSHMYLDITYSPTAIYQLSVNNNVPLYINSFIKINKYIYYNEIVRNNWLISRLTIIRDNYQYLINEINTIISIIDKIDTNLPKGQLFNYETNLNILVKDKKYSNNNDNFNKLLIASDNTNKNKLIINTYKNNENLLNTNILSFNDISIKYKNEWKLYNKGVYYYRILLSISILFFILIMIISHININKNFIIGIFIILIILILFLILFIYKKPNIEHFTDPSPDPVIDLVKANLFDYDNYKIAVEKYKKEVLFYNNSVTDTHITNLLNKSRIADYTNEYNNKIEYYKTKIIDLSGGIEVLKITNMQNYYIILLIYVSFIFILIGLILYYIYPNNSYKIIISVIIFYLLTLMILFIQIHKITSMDKDKNYWSNLNPSLDDLD
jgi:hypothetical protein